MHKFQFCERRRVSVDHSTYTSTEAYQEGVGPPSVCTRDVKDISTNVRMPS
jgi:hypothetical protein